MTASNEVRYKPTPGLWLFKNYVKLIHNKLFYRHTYIIGKENLPPNGVPTLIACNHQNCMNDPLGLLFTLRRYAKFYTRADIFKSNLTRKFLYWIGLLPAYRADFDGIDSVKNNNATWETGERLLVGGQTIVIFPEGMHQDIHWLGSFTTGFTKLAFEAAQMSNFTKEIFIQPAANHYLSYNHMQSDLVIAYGEPVSIAPYYELYKTKPRTAQREVSRIVHERISELMLDIKDVNDYAAIDYIRNTYGVDFARQKGLDPRRTDQKLQSDKELVRQLADYSLNNEEEAKALYIKVNSLRESQEHLGLRDWLFDAKFSWASAILETICMIILLPLFVLALIPNILVYTAPYLITPKLKDQMFKASIYFGLSVVTIPILYLLTFIVDLCMSGDPLIALMHTLLLPILGLFAWYYRLNWIKLRAKFKYLNYRSMGKIDDIATLRKVIRTQLEKIIRL